MKLKKYVKNNVCLRRGFSLSLFFFHPIVLMIIYDSIYSIAKHVKYKTFLLRILYFSFQILIEKK